MKQISWLISKYLLWAIIPYFIFSWLLLSVILFVQQASRFSDIFFSVNVPSDLTWQLSIALIPNVIAFTCPMAILVGTIIGLAKMQSDSELIAIRAAGIGHLQIAAPIMVLGALLSAFAFLVNIEGVPLAARLVRNVAMQTAIKKLESPIEPGIFNSEVAGYTIYVKEGDPETGRWKNIFIYNEDKGNGGVRLITSRSGRIDVADQASELVLENASVATLPLVPGGGKYVVENIGEIRLAIRTRRAELIDKLSADQLSLDELGLRQLSEFADASDGKQRLEARILWQRRILLSLTPFIFCLLGTSIVLRFNRGGRGFAIAVALIVLLGFYLLTFLGEQLVRVGTIAVVIGGLIPIAGSGAAIAWFSLSRNMDLWRNLGNYATAAAAGLRKGRERVKIRDVFVDLTTGLRDFDMIRNIVTYFALTLCFLTAIFIIFTAFELWKFAGMIDGGTLLLGKYLFYLMPFIYLQIAPSAAMIAVIATYVIKSRQNELVTWVAAGQSSYRLLAPCLVLMLVIGGVDLLVEESILPQANRLQDATRNQIRNRGLAPNWSGKNWVARGNRIYSFEVQRNIDEVSISSQYQDRPFILAASENQRRGTLKAGEGLSARPASDNAARQIGPQWGSALPTFYGAFGNLLSGAVLSVSDNETVSKLGGSAAVKNLTVYEFGEQSSELQSVFRAEAAVWKDGQIVVVGKAERDVLSEGKIQHTEVRNEILTEPSNPFTEIHRKSSHMTSGELRQRIAASESETDRRNLSIALQKRYTVLLLPLVMALFAAPFSLSFRPKGKAAAVAGAVGLWLLFTGTSGVFEQFGLNGSLTPAMAIWSPLSLFALIGLYLLARNRT
jgi:lipopolysaccharide export LptBFGC system permease protein LptF